MKPSLVILAAGMGSRYGGLKQMDEFGPNGETIIDYSIYDAIQAGFGKVVFVIRESFKEAFKDFFTGKFENRIEVVFVTQELGHLPSGYQVPDGREKPWGTAHAVQMAKDVVNEPFLVINADDYYGKDAYKVAADFFRQLPVEPTGKKIYNVIGYKLINTLSEYGTVNRGVCEADLAGNLTGIKECKKIMKEADGVVRYPEGEEKLVLEEDAIVSMNMWGFYPSYFKFFDREFSAFLQEQGDQLTSEYYIPDIIDTLIASDEAEVKVLASDSNWFGVTYLEDKPHVVAKLEEMISKGLYPENLWAD
jgi:dTDP-glucose pyrophosphorylase